LYKKLFVFLFLVANHVLCAADTALDRYVRKPDDSYKWDIVGNIPCGGCTAVVLDMKSQTWRKLEEVDRTVWQHYVTVIRPEKVTTNIAYLFITGGSNNGRAPTNADAMLASIAKESGAVVAELRQIPNEPLKFAGETKTRTEDGIIAYTWDKFLRGADEEWPLRLPMTKAAVRAMDTVVEFSKTGKGGKLDLRKFVVSGGSKRGWTTWTTAAVDERVIAIAPAVIDMLNVEKSFVHHWRVYGFWAPAVGDYVAMKTMDWLGTKQNHALMKIEEPYQYRDRLTMPKFIVNSAGDQFFLPDSWQFYWKDLKGEKYLRYVPNSDHSLRNSDVAQSLTAWFQSIVNNRPRPRFNWRVEKDGTIRVKTVDKPAEVRLWQATNPEARDFRLEKIGPAYKATKIEAGKDGEYLGRVNRPGKGYTAYFVELAYPSGGRYPLKVTTGVKVWPDTYPFPAPKFMRDSATKVAPARFPVHQPGSPLK
jgi:PhoPQ-activated pathogenicity-related protein